MQSLIIFVLWIILVWITNIIILLNCVIIIWLVHHLPQHFSLIFFAHPINQESVCYFYNFPGPIRSFKGKCAKVQDKWPIFFWFKEFSRNKVKFKDFSRFAQTLLNAGQKYCRMLLRKHSAILSTFIKLPFVILKIFVLSIFLSGRFAVHVLFYHIRHRCLNTVS